MQIKKGFKLRHIDDLYVVIAGASAAQDFHGMITLNESGAFLWELLQNSVSEEELIEALCAEYEIGREIAVPDVKKFISVAREQDLLDE